MASLDSNESHPLTDGMIDELVTRTSPGNYALGYMDGATFMVFYVGRSDSDVNHHLHDWVGKSSRYKRFAPSAQAAWGSRQQGPLPLGSPTLERVGMGVTSSYTRFAFSYASSAQGAFDEQCRSYHDFGGSDGLDNGRHPVGPPGSRWECPVHGQ